MDANRTVCSATMLRKANEIIVEWLKSKDTEKGHRFNVNTTGKLAEVATSLPCENSGSSSLDTSQEDQRKRRNKTAGIKAGTLSSFIFVSWT